MKKILLILVMVGMGLDAREIYADYSITFGVLGEVGRAKAKLVKSSDRYTIEIAANAQGVAKSLSSDHKETHRSRGSIQNGIMVSDEYQSVVTYGSKVEKKTYTIDHKNKKVTLLKQKYKKNKLTLNETKTLGYYAKDDLLTLYFNIYSLVKEKEKKANYIFHAVGAEKQNGKVEIKVPDKQNRQKYVNDLGGGANWYVAAIIYQKIFSSNKGELYLAVDKEGITSKAILKDVLLYGDVLATRVK